MGRKSRLKRERSARSAAGQAATARGRALAIERFEKSLGRKLDGIAPPGPGPKMSDTLFEFAEPLIEGLRAQSSAQLLERVLSFASTIWNAELLGGEKQAKALRDLENTMIGAELDPPFVRGLVQELAERRRSKFGADRRVVGSVSVVEHPIEGLHLTATYIQTTR